MAKKSMTKKTSSNKKSIKTVRKKKAEKKKASRTGRKAEKKSGGAISYQRVFLTWQRVCELAGIRKNIHTFRHTAATYLLERGVPVAEVSRILGHADATITYKMYVHSIPNYNQRIIDQFRQKNKKESKHTQKHTQKI